MAVDTFKQGDITLSTGYIRIYVDVDTLKKARILRIDLQSKLITLETSHAFPGNTEKLLLTMADLADLLKENNAHS